MKLKFKVGDKVRIKSIDWYNKNKNNNGDIKSIDRGYVYFTRSMSQYCGKVAVEEIYDKTFDATLCTSTKQVDNVSHPSHYTWLKEKCGIEVIDITRHMDFDLGNALKYILRSERKKEQGMSDKEKAIEDLEKAIFYIKDKIKLIKEQ